MSKRKTVRVTVLSALTMVCLFSAVITAQKTPQGTAGTPVKGIDVIVMDNSGNIVNRLTTNDKGEVKFVGLAPGNYSLTIADAAKQRPASAKLGIRIDDLDNYEVAIVGALGGPIKRDWNLKVGGFAKATSHTARVTAAPSYEDRITFEIGAGDPSPVLTTIIRSRSNVRNN